MTEAHEIDLGRGHKAFVDAADAELVAGYSWRWMKPSKHAQGVGYAQANITIERGKYAVVLLHRLITDAKKGDVVDFRDKDGLNCRRENLRLCTRMDSAKNAKIRQQSKTGIRNVMLQKDGRYRVAIWRDKVMHRRRFATLEAAVAWADEMRPKLHGEFVYSSTNDHRAA
jgi:hypothetical protein